MTTTPTDFRALCEELADRLQHAITSAHADSYYGENREVIDRARAALAEPEPKEPSDAELDRLTDSIEWKGSPRHWGRKIIRAAFTRWRTPANAH